MKQIIAIESTLEARRLLRSIRIDVDKSRRDMSKIASQNIRAERGARISKEKRALAENILKKTRYNLKQVEHIKNLLQTHLFENTNLNNKLSRQAQMLINETNGVKQDAEELTAGKIPSTKTDNPFGVILSDVHKRLSKHANVSVGDTTLFTQDENLFGVIPVGSSHSKDKLFIVLTCIEGENKYKTFLNDLPVEQDPLNMAVFLSPSQLYKTLLEVLTLDKILRL